MIWLLAFLAGLVALVLFESWRQGRRYRSSGRGQAGGLLRAGMLEAQQLLEPDRKVEVLRQQEDREALQVRFRKPDAQGDGPEEGSPARGTLE